MKGIITKENKTVNKIKTYLKNFNKMVEISCFGPEKVKCPFSVFKCII